MEDKTNQEVINEENMAMDQAQEQPPEDTTTDAEVMEGIAVEKQGKSPKKKAFFWKLFSVYAVLLVVLGTAAVLQVRGILQEYEETQPQYHVSLKLEEMLQHVEAGDFYVKYLLPEISAGRFEEEATIKSEYLALFQADQLTIGPKPGSTGEEECAYLIKNGEMALVEVDLKATGPAQTKLAILNFRPWKVEQVKLLLPGKDYEMILPAEFSVSVNGIPLEVEDAHAIPKDENEVRYVLEGLYLPPEIEIKDWNGKQVAYQTKDNKILADYYSYNLELPKGISVKVNGRPFAGEGLEENLLRYDILELTQPKVELRDVYGNVVNYEGGKLPLTATVLRVDSAYEVSVAGQEIPEEYIQYMGYPEYAPMMEYVEELPQIAKYLVAVLEEDVAIEVTDREGQTVSLEDGKTEYELLWEPELLQEVPEEVAEEIDVLDVAKNWSLFMSADLEFADMSKHLIKGSYQYNVAKRYAGGVDITFISGHVLDNPAFTEEEVSNFAWITEDCFAVDVSFVKHMRLNRGKKIEDVMNDRFYFVRIDDTKDGKDNATWKLVSMKENITDAE